MFSFQTMRKQFTLLFVVRAKFDWLQSVTFTAVLLVFTEFHPGVFAQFCTYRNVELYKDWAQTCNKRQVQNVSSFPFQLGTSLELACFHVVWTLRKSYSIWLLQIWFEPHSELVWNQEQIEIRKNVSPRILSPCNYRDEWCDAVLLHHSDKAWRVTRHMSIVISCWQLTSQHKCYSLPTSPAPLPQQPIPLGQRLRVGLSKQSQTGLWTGSPKNQIWETSQVQLQSEHGQRWSELDDPIFQESRACKHS